MSIRSQLSDVRETLPEGVTLVAVSKTHAPALIEEAYAAGQRIFGESRPQELREKYEALPKDIEWHMIGHLQTNKVKLIIPYVSMIHSVDSAKLLGVINEQALKHNRVVDLLFEVHIAQEESKHGWNAEELIDYLRIGEYRTLSGVCYRGLMGVATNTDDEQVVEAEFTGLHDLMQRLKPEFFDDRFDTLSMGMSGDYRLAIACGSNMVRIGSAIFGARQYNV